MNKYFTKVSLRKPLLSILLAGLALLIFSANLFAGSLSFAWNASTSANVGGYKLFYGGTSKNYTASVDVGNKTSYQATGLTDGATYFFAVKAYDSARTTESGYSNEISAKVPASTTLSADFTANKTSGTGPLLVSFTPITTGTVTGWSWNFGSSAIPVSKSQYPTVTYSTPGTYSVSLTITGPNGSVTKTKTSFITVASTSPVANFSATPTSGVAPITVKFTDASAGSITSRSWNFGDGTGSTAINPTHTYSVAGVYSVRLTVTGSGGSNTKTSTNLINVSSVSGSATSSNGLVAAYGFEETGGTTVADASGKGNHGTIKEAARSTGRYGKALHFDGVNDWITVNDSASLDLSTAMTLEAWVYPQSQTNGGNTVILKEMSGGEIYSVYSDEDANLPVSYINNGSYRAVFGTKRLPANMWTHLVGTYDGQYQRLYVNGVEVAKSAQNGLIKQSSGVLRIGGNSIWGEYFHGYIDEVRIYNRSLTATEVKYNLKTAISVSNPK